MKVNGVIQQTQENWPQCFVCKKGVDAAKVQEAGPDPDRPRYVVLWAKCHGKESYYRADFNTGIPISELRWVMGTAKFFNEANEHETDDSRRPD